MLILADEPVGVAGRAGLIPARTDEPVRAQKVLIHRWVLEPLWLLGPVLGLDTVRGPF